MPRKYTTERTATLDLFKAYKPSRCLWVGAFDGAVLRNAAVRNPQTDILAFDNWGGIESAYRVTHYDILTPAQCDKIMDSCTTRTNKLKNIDVRRQRIHFAIEYGIENGNDFWYLNSEMAVLYDDLCRISEARPVAVMSGTGLFDMQKRSAIPNWSYGSLIARDIRCFADSRQYDLKLFGSGVWSLVPQTIGA